MDNNAINNIVIKEIEALKKLLSLMEEQHSLFIKNDMLQLEGIVEKITLCNKEIAQAEVERRKLLSGESMRQAVMMSKNEELIDNYRTIKKLLNEIKVQKETNEMLFRMGLGFTTKMMNILNPDRNVKTYNAYGKLKR